MPGDSSTVSSSSSPDDDDDADDDPPGFFVAASSTDDDDDNFSALDSPECSRWYLPPSACGNIMDDLQKVLQKRREKLNL